MKLPRPHVIVPVHLQFMGDGRTSRRLSRACSMWRQACYPSLLSKPFADVQCRSAIDSFACQPEEGRHRRCHL